MALCAFIAILATLPALHLCASELHDEQYCDAGKLCHGEPKSTIFHDHKGIIDILNVVQKIAQGVNQTQVVTDLKKMEAELETQQVRVGFVGMMKVGKSATLNALLHKRILPSAVQAETAIEVIITHDIHARDGVLVGERFTNSTEEIAKGVSNIHSKLWNINKKKRSKQNEYKKVWLNISIPFLSELTNDFSLTISDTPGSDEAVLESLGLESSIQQLAAFVIVLDYRKMKSEAEISLLKLLKQQHPTIFNTPGRLLFILNHMNSFDEHRAVKMEDSIKPFQAPRFVAEYLQEHLQVKISSDQVIPYSAYWALESRICLDNPDHVDDSIIEEAQLIVRNQGQSDGANDSSTDNMAMCKKLERYSKISDIEKRLVQLFVEYGHKVIEKDIAEKAMQNVSSLIKNLTEKMDELNVPEANKTALHQKHLLVSMTQMIDDIPTRLKDPLDMLQTSAITNLSLLWTSNIANVTDVVLEDLDAVVFRSHNDLKSAVQNVSTQFFEILMKAMNQSFTDVMQRYNNSVYLQFQAQITKIRQELFHLSGNKSMSSFLHSTTTFFPSVPPLSQCNISNLQNVNNTDTCIRDQKVNTTRKSTSWSCFFVSCEDLVETTHVYVVKSLTLKNKIVKSLDHCFQMIISQATNYTTSVSSSANIKLINNMAAWWKNQEINLNTNLQNSEAKLKEVEEQAGKLDDHIKTLKDALTKLDAGS